MHKNINVVFKIQFVLFHIYLQLNNIFDGITNSSSHLGSNI